MITRLIQEIGIQRDSFLRVLGIYTTAAFFAYLSRLFWPLQLTPHAITGALSHARDRFVQFWRNSLS